MAWSDILSGSTAWLIAILLLSLRIGAMLFMTPIFSGANVPATVRILMVLGVSTVLALGIGGASAEGWQAGFTQLSSWPGALMQAACCELALGITLGVAIHLAFAVFAIAGRLLDIQIGFGLAQVFDPAFNASSPVLTAAFNQLALMVFFLLDGHHAVFRAVAYSLERFPLGQAWPISAALLPVARQVGGLLALAFALAAPIVFCILLVELALGVLARNLPQLNMLTMGVPIKIVVGLVALCVWLGGIGPVMNRVYREIYTTWDAIFAAESVQARPEGAR